MTTIEEARDACWQAFRLIREDLARAADDAAAESVALRIAMAADATLWVTQVDAAAQYLHGDSDCRA